MASHTDPPFSRLVDHTVSSLFHCLPSHNLMCTCSTDIVKPDRGQRKKTKKSKSCVHCLPAA